MGTPLTEERFIAVLSEFQKSIDARFTKIDDRFKKIEDAIKEVKGFQEKESKAIELDLEMLLKKYLSKKFVAYEIEPFPIKYIYDPYTKKELTEVDAAFLLSPLQPSPNYTRLIEAGINMKVVNNIKPHSYIFVIAEAKHHMTKKKITQKLEQFDKLKNLFALAKRIANSDVTVNINAKNPFFDTVKRNEFMSHVNDMLLFFGAAYWDPRVLPQLLADIKAYKNLVGEFRNAKNAATKQQIYNNAYKIEKRWYDNPKLLSTEEVSTMPNLQSSLQHVECIVPSGERYSVLENPEPEGYSSFGGNYRLRKTIRNG